MKKHNEFNFLVRAGLLKTSYVLLKKEIERLQHPEKLLPDTAITRLKKEKNLKKTIKLLSITHSDNKYLNGLAAIADDIAIHQYISQNELAQYHDKREQCIRALPGNIAALKELKAELKVLIDQADHREPRLFKSGNLKESIKDCIDINEVKTLLVVAQATLDSVLIYNTGHSKSL